jgi:hypothetical protein
MTETIEVEKRKVLAGIEQWMRVVFRNRLLIHKYGALYLRRFYQRTRDRQLTELGEEHGHLLLQGVLPEVTKAHHKHVFLEVIDAFLENQSLSRRSFCPQKEPCILAHIGACPLIHKKMLAEGYIVTIRVVSSYHDECEIVCIMGVGHRLRAYPIGRANHMPFPFPTLPGYHADETYHSGKYLARPYTRAEFQAYLGLDVSPARLVALTLIGTPSDNALGFLVGPLRFSSEKHEFLRPLMDCETTDILLPALIDASRKQPVREGFTRLYAVAGTSTLQYVCLTSGLLMKLGIEVLAPSIIRYGAEQVLRVSSGDHHMWYVRLRLAASSKRSMVGFNGVEDLARRFNLSACTDLVESLIEVGLPVLVVSLVIELTQPLPDFGFSAKSTTMTPALK